jgi:hypothetical protein
MGLKQSAPEVRVSKFRHPYLTRGIIHTSSGAFAVCRGIVDAPDAVGHDLGWPPIDEDPAIARLADPMAIRVGLHRSPTMIAAADDR